MINKQSQSFTYFCYLPSNVDLPFYNWDKAHPLEVEIDSFYKIACHTSHAAMDL